MTDLTRLRRTTRLYCTAPSVETFCWYDPLTRTHHKQEADREYYYVATYRANGAAGRVLAIVYSGYHANAQDALDDLLQRETAFPELVARLRRDESIYAQQDAAA